ncbi:CRE-ZIP-1 protein [Caenorhabditis remanei]|uniref:CRE-ZIP-1 protein n=1 Tax=Caenorhabditis remanei TaxID=31234 RepID=E3NAK7_CAERE|nr:CRE-ZIP-1 protein [Caenorhabditis remanei]
MNNQNDNIEDIDLGVPPELMEMEIPADIMDTCNKTVFNEVPGIIECEGSVAEVDILDLDAPVLHNNQQDEFLMEFNPEKPIIAYPNDMTLTELNGGRVTDENFGFECEEEKTLIDLDNVHSNPPPYAAGYGQNQEMGMNQQFEELGLEQKPDYYAYQQAEQTPTLIYRAEFEQEQQYVQPVYLEDQKAFYLENEQNLARRDASNEYNHAQIRSKLGLTTKTAWGTVVFVERLSKAEKEARKKAQNKENAKNCVARKNNGKKELQANLPHLQNNANIMENQNEIQENGLLAVYNDVIYPSYQNNSQFGSTEQFAEQLRDQKEYVCEEILDNNGFELHALEKDHKETKAKFDEISSKNGEEGVPQNTFASRKSRAKTASELAELRYQTKLVEIEILKKEAVGQVLEGFTSEINQILERLGEKKLPEKIFYEGLMEQFEPS